MMPARQPRAPRLRKLMAAAPEQAPGRCAQLEKVFTYAHAFQRREGEAWADAAAGTAGTALVPAVRRDVVKALLNMARVLRSADAHRDVPSHAEGT